MVKKSKLKLIAYLLTFGMTIIGCEKESEIISATEDNVTTNDNKDSIVIDSVEKEAEKILDGTQETLVEETVPEIIKYEHELYKVINNTKMKSDGRENALDIIDIPNGAHVYKIFSGQNGWDLISYNNELGYIKTDLMECTNETIELDYAHSSKNDIALTTTNLNFRRYPTTSSDIITTFNPSVELEVLAEINNGWLLVRNSGIIGYVHKDYTVSLTEVLKNIYPDLDIDRIDVKKVVYSNTTLNFRNNSNTDSEVIRKLERFESLRVLKEIGDWYLVMTNEYEFGYVHKDYTKDLADTYIIVDLSSQRLFMYNEEDLLFTTPVTTGKDSTPSDKGLFKIYAKETQRYLVGADYRAYVEYWMPYNGGEGLHDASWRYSFGTENYKTSGSHGCINLPPQIADEIYNNSEVGTKVLVHK